MIREYKWSTISLSITVGVYLAMWASTEYQYRAYHIKDFSSLSPLGGMAALAGVGTGIVALVKEKASLVSGIAVAIGALSIMFYVV